MKIGSCLPRLLAPLYPQSYHDHRLNQYTRFFGHVKCPSVQKWPFWMEIIKINIDVVKSDPPRRMGLLRDLNVVVHNLLFWSFSLPRRTGDTPFLTCTAGKSTITAFFPGVTRSASLLCPRRRRRSIRVINPDMPAQEVTGRSLVCRSMSANRMQGLASLLVKVLSQYGQEKQSPRE